MLNTLHFQMVSDLRHLYQSETLLSPFFSEMTSLAHSAPLRELLADMQQNSRKNQEAISTLFTLLKTDSLGKTCQAIQGLIQECRGIVSDLPSPTYSDICLISCCRRLIYYRLALIQNALNAARVLKRANIAMVLNRCETSEKELEASLDRLATGGAFSKGLFQQTAD